MRKLLSRLGLCTLVVFSVSCSTTRQVFNNTEQISIDSLVAVRPWVNISYINNEGKETFSDSLSAESEALLNKAILAGNMRIGEIIDVEYSREKNLDLRRLLVSSINRQPQELASMAVADSVCNIIRNAGYRYGMLMVTRGFARDKSDYKKKAATGIATSIIVGILTLGMVVPISVPYKSSNEVFMLIVDSEQRKVVFHSKSTQKEMNPLDPGNLEYQIRQLSQDYHAAGY